MSTIHSLLLKLKGIPLDLIDLTNATFEPFKDFTRSEWRPTDQFSDLDYETRLNRLESHYEGLLEPQGFLRGNRSMITEHHPNDMGDMCVWQGVFAGMRALRHRNMLTEDTKRDALAAAHGLSQFIQGSVLCRGVTPIDFDPNIYVQDPSKAEQYFMADGRMAREDASLDSLCGLLFGASLVNRLSPMGMPAIAKSKFSYFLNQFKVDNFRLRNRDGSFTPHGDCRPGLLQYPLRNLVAATAEALLEDLQHNMRYRDVTRKYSQDFKRVETHFLSKRGWYNDHIATLALCAFLATCEYDDEWHDDAMDGLRRLAKKHEKSGNAFILYAASGFGIHSYNSKQMKIADKVMCEFSASNQFPNGKVHGPTKNSEDPTIDKVEWGKKLQATQPIPMWKRPATDIAWQRNPYQLDGGGDSKLSSLDFLVAFWMRRKVLG